MQDRLPACAKPVHYALTLHPDLQSFTFAGKAVIEVEVVEETSCLTLNARELTIKQADVQVTLGNGTKVEVTRVSFDDQSHRVCLHLAQAVQPPHTLTLAIAYEGVLNDQMGGFYRSSYKVGSETRFMASTHFEAVSARRAFPCWDEPALKATFDIVLVVPDDRVALANTDVVKTTTAGDVKTVVFRRTPKMSTYLVAFAVGEFDYTEAHTSNGLPVRVYTPPGKKEEGEFALSMATKAMDYYDAYFAIPYPLPKLDLVAIPDFAIGAMENWGLVTFRSVRVLFNAATTPAPLKHHIAYVVGHELAHMWFGNLVTMEWWTDLWLKEAFATWVGWKVTHHVFPEWKVWEQFLVGEFGRAQHLDARLSSHPIEVEVNKAEQVDEIFDAISYSKGASVLRMLASWLGEDAFNRGICKYLKDNQYGNTRTVDLWRALSESSGKDVAALMGSWTLQTGYPVVKVGCEEGKLVVSQSRFLVSGHDPNDGALWCIPLTPASNRTEPNKPASDVLDKASAVLSLAAPAADGDWLKLNLSQTGFFRVWYDDALLPFVAASSLHLSASDRCGLASDAFALAAAGYTSTTTFLRLLASFHPERSFVVWRTLCNCLNELLSVWAEEEAEVRSKLGELVRDLVVPVAQELGWEPKPGEGDLVGMLRALAVGEAAVLGDQALLAEARRRFELFRKGDAGAIAPDLRCGVLAAVIRHGDATTLDHVMELYRKCESQDQRVVLLEALGSAPSPELVTKVLDFALSNEVRSQDIHTTLAGCASSAVGRSVTWAYVKNNWATFHARLGGSSILLGRVVRLVVETFSSDAAARDVEAFFAANQVPGLARTLQQSLESIRTREKWLLRDRARVKAFCLHEGGRKRKREGDESKEEP